MIDRWLYFGCDRYAGHYLFGETGRSLEGMSYLQQDRFNRFDGLLPPQPERDCDLYKATFSALPDFGGCALSWWDRSVDRRPGSNSTIFAPGPDWEAEALLSAAPEHFPWVFTRLPQPLALLPARA